MEIYNFYDGRNGFVTLLGSWIFNDLNDSFGFSSRIKSKLDNKSPHFFFWQAKQVDVHSKYVLYIIIFHNILLWSFESRNISKDHFSKLDVLIWNI